VCVNTWFICCLSAYAPPHSLSPLSHIFAECGLRCWRRCHRRRRRLGCSTLFSSLAFLFCGNGNNKVDYNDSPKKRHTDSRNNNAHHQIFERKIPFEIDQTFVAGSKILNMKRIRKLESVINAKTIY